MRKGSRSPFLTILEGGVTSNSVQKDNLQKRINKMKKKDLIILRVYNPLKKGGKKKCQM